MCGFSVAATAAALRHSCLWFSSMFWSHKLSSSTNEVQYALWFKASNGVSYLADWRDIERVFELDPNGYTDPNPNHNVLSLTAEDHVWLWSIGIGL
jgi:hypothetical protein